jgi:hypothetical protein
MLDWNGKVGIKPLFGKKNARKKFFSLKLKLKIRIIFRISSTIR